VDEALRTELERMREADQAIRVEARAVVEAHGLASPEYAELRTRGRALDGRHVARLVEILERHGWPGRSLVGETACQGAFLVLQHADLAVQKRYLPLVRAATAAGEIERTALPLLEDRVLMAEGRKQIYGSQLSRAADGRIEPWPIEDPARVDERRASVGLEPLADYLRRFGLGASRRTEAGHESGGRG
jgi:hypothetical protein